MQSISHPFPSDLTHAIGWARNLLKDEFVILDSETTGLYNAEFVQLAIINQKGETLLNTLVKPEYPEAVMHRNGSGCSAFDIHGIGPDKLVNAPVFPEIYQQVADILTGQRLVIYNWSYDWPILRRSCNHYGLAVPEIIPTECAMEMYAQFVGEWNDYHCSYRWQKLQGGDHSALGDCLATLKLLWKMADSGASS